MATTRKPRHVLVVAAIFVLLVLLGLYFRVLRYDAVRVSEAGGHIISVL
jgi:hypothetical protein